MDIEVDVTLKIEAIYVPKVVLLAWLLSASPFAKPYNKKPAWVTADQSIEAAVAVLNQVKRVYGKAALDEVLKMVDS